HLGLQPTLHAAILFVQSLELSRLEFNLDVDELRAFTQELEACNDEIARSAILQQAVQARGIELPFEMGNVASTRTWLASLA
ncbi:hypothetical protein WLF18_24520, partial [Pseudomonas shirazensis]